jgi:hypothetical protein
MTDTLITLAAWAVRQKPPIHPANARKLAQAGRITGAQQIGRSWVVPQDAPRPPALRAGPKPKQS